MVALLQRGSIRNVCHIPCCSIAARKIMAYIPTAVFVRLAVVALACLSLCAAGPTCQPQGRLRLDEPYPGPSRVNLPFCGQYHCSCCNTSHALTLAAAHSRALEDSDVTPPCRSALLALTCRVCDPDVGTGAKRTACGTFCQRLYEACKKDYFGFSSADNVLTPCPSGGGSGMLVCSTLEELAGSPAEACTAAGLTMQQQEEGSNEEGSSSSSSGSSCWDGSPVPSSACPASSPVAAGRRVESSQLGWLYHDPGRVNAGDWVGGPGMKLLVGTVMVALVLGAGGMAVAGWRHQAARKAAAAAVASGYRSLAGDQQARVLAQRQLLAQAAAKRFADAAVADAAGARDTTSGNQEQAAADEDEQRPKKA